ncbi:MAG: hypothetical protein ACXQT2_04465 [Methanotrichaceae archaeon]
MSFVVWFCKGWLMSLAVIDLVGAGIEFKEDNYVSGFIELFVGVVNMVLAVVL